MQHSHSVALFLVAWLWAIVGATLTGYYAGAHALAVFMGVIALFAVVLRGVTDIITRVGWVEQ